MSEATDRPVTLRNEMLGTPAVPMEEFDELTEIRRSAGKSVCKITTSEGNIGTGALYQVSGALYSNTNRFLILTCNHVLPIISNSELTHVNLQFKDIQEMASINLDKQQVLFAWTTKILDATVIEISVEMARMFLSKGAQFLKVGTLHESLPNIKIVMLQYPSGKYSIAHGDIENIEGSNVFYRIGTAPGSSGSPLLSLDGKALAMHNAGPNNPGITGDNPNAERKAIVLSSVIDAYLKEFPNNEQVADLQSQVTILQYIKYCKFLRFNFIF